MIIAKDMEVAFKEILVRVFGATVSDRGSDFIAVVDGQDVVIGNLVGATYSITCRNLNLLKQLEGMWTQALIELQKQQNASTCTEEKKDAI